MFADCEHGGARTLLADTLEQLAYGAENATWRNFFLSGATELRDGNFGTATQSSSPTLLSQLTPEQIFDGLAISVNGPRAWDLDIAIDVTLADRDANYRLTVCAYDADGKLNEFVGDHSRDYMQKEDVRLC